MPTNATRLARARQRRLDLRYTDAIERVVAAEAIPGLLLAPRAVHLAANVALLARLAERQLPLAPPAQGPRPAAVYFGDPEAVVRGEDGGAGGQVVWRCVSGSDPTRLRRAPGDRDPALGFAWGYRGSGPQALARALAFDVGGREDRAATMVVLDHEVALAHPDLGYVVTAADVAVLLAAVPAPR